jgi:hypothetical protein
MDSKRKQYTQKLLCKNGHPVILATWEAEIGIISPGKMFGRPYLSQKNLSVVSHTYHPSYAVSINRWSQSMLVGYKHGILFLKYLKQKELGSWPKWYSTCLASTRS